MLFDSDIQDNNLQAYMNMIKYLPLMLFDMPACHAWAHREFLTPHTNITTYIELTKGDSSYRCSGATKYHLVTVWEHFIACATLVTFGQRRGNFQSHKTELYSWNRKYFI